MAVVGVGETKMRDDGVGPFVVVELLKRALGVTGRGEGLRVEFVRRANEVASGRGEVETSAAAGARRTGRYESLLIINANTTPEHWTDELVQFSPDLVLLVDAAELGAVPPHAELVDADRIVEVVPVSTHTLPLSVFVDDLRSKIPGVVVKLLGVQPEVVDGNRRIEYYVPPMNPSFDLFLETCELDENIPFFAFDVGQAAMAAAEAVVTALLDFFDEVGILPRGSRRNL